MAARVGAKAIGYAFDQTKQDDQTAACNGRQDSDPGFCKSAILNDIRKKLEGLGHGT